MLLDAILFIVEKVNFGTLSDLLMSIAGICATLFVSKLWSSSFKRNFSFKYVRKS
jgi:hypothetical protein